MTSRDLPPPTSTPPPPPALFTACTVGQTAAVGRLLNLGADPNSASHSGATPLFGACANGHGDIVKVSDRGKRGKVALDESV